MTQQEQCDCNHCNSSPDVLLGPGGSVAIAARSTATSTATARSLAVAAATSGTTASSTTTTSAATAAGLALTTATGAAATASGLTSDFVETVVAVGLSWDLRIGILAGRLRVPGLAGKVTTGRIVGPARNLRLRRNGRCGRGCVDLLVGSGNDLVALINTLLLSSSSCVPSLACDVAFGLDGGARGLFRSGWNTVGLRLLKLGQTGVCSGGIGAGGNVIVDDSLRCGFDVFGGRSVRDSGLLDLGDCDYSLAEVLR
jgi:hypothetical protein